MTPKKNKKKLKKGVDKTPFFCYTKDKIKEKHLKGNRRKKMDCRHSAYDLVTGQIINCPGANQLKKAVALTQRVDKELYGVTGQWRFSHDFGRRWRIEGLPKK